MTFRPISLSTGSYIILVLSFDISLAQWLFLEYHFKWWILYSINSFIYTFIPSLVEAFAAIRLIFLFSILYDISCSLDFSYFYKTYLNYSFISPSCLFVLIVIFILKLKKDEYVESGIFYFINNDWLFRNITFLHDKQSLKATLFCVLQNMVQV